MTNRMGLYLTIVSNTIKTNLAYRAGLFFSLILRTVVLFATIAIWEALYTGRTSMATAAGDVTLKNMITYALLSACLNLVVSSDIIRRIHEKITSGDIGLDLVKPVSTKLFLFCRSLGESLARLLLQILPFLLVSLLFFRIDAPSLPNAVFFLLSLAGAFILNFLLFYIFGLCGFWWLTVNHLDFFLRNIAGFFSGVFVPLWFFPDTLRSVSEFLPFRYIYYAPIAIFLGKMEGGAVIAGLAGQWLWIIILLFVEKRLWTAGIKKLVIQGG